MIEDAYLCDDENALEVITQQLMTNLITGVGIG